MSAHSLYKWVKAIKPDKSEEQAATLIYRQTENIRAVQLFLGHSKLESSVRHLGIDVDDALEISEQIDV